MLIKELKVEMLNYYCLTDKKMPGLPLFWRGNEGEAL